MVGQRLPLCAAIIRLITFDPLVNLVSPARIHGDSLTASDSSVAQVPNDEVWKNDLITIRRENTDDGKTITSPCMARETIPTLYLE